MRFPDFIVNWDTQAFLAVYALPHPPLATLVAQMLSGLGNTGFIWFIVALWIFMREEKRDRRFFIPIVTAAIVGWILSELIIKDFVGRLRPVYAIPSIIVSPLPTGFSFPSTHALLAFALVVVIGQKETRWKWWFYVLAFLISFSRVYIGHHYPLDVIAGGVTGVLIGYTVVVLNLRYIRVKALSQKQEIHSIKTHIRKKAGAGK